MRGQDLDERRKEVEAQQRVWARHQQDMARAWRKGLGDSLDRAGFASVDELLDWSDDLEALRGRAS